MRFPLRYQFLMPLLVVAIASLALTALLNARAASHRTKARIEQQLQGVVEVLLDNRFPLTDAVLSQMGELANAEFVLTDSKGGLLASSDNDITEIDLPHSALSVSSAFDVSLGKPTTIGGVGYFHTIFKITARPPLNKPQVLHTLFPQDEFNTAWRATFLPPLVVGFATIAAVFAVIHLAASRISRVLNKLGDEVNRLAEGGFNQAELPRVDDETRDLAKAVNQTAVRLEEYEKEVRSAERMNALSMLGAGLAHDIRNAASGCRLAIELHAEETLSTMEDADCLDIAKRQLTLIESRLQQFLQLDGEIPQVTFQEIDLVKLVSNIVTLVAPLAKHARICLEWKPEGKMRVSGSQEQLDRAITNLVLNAFDAVAKEQAANSRPVYVRIELQGDGNQVELTVADNGKGPADEVVNSLFEPFVTEKPEGIGLGLAVSQRVIESHGGSIDWRRQDDETWFVVRLPAVFEEESYV